MNPETLIQVNVGTFFAIVGIVINVLILGPIAWIVKDALKAQKEIKETHVTFEMYAHREFMRKTDYIRDMDEIKSLLRNIFDKLDGKADK